MKINDKVEIVIEFDRYNEIEVNKIMSAFSYICRNTNVDVSLGTNSLTFSGDVRAVAAVYSNTMHYFHPLTTEG